MNNMLRRSWFKYLMVGAVSAGVYFSVFSLSLYVFVGHYIAATTLGYFIAVCVHFLGNRYITFHDQAHPQVTRVIVKYMAMLLINYGLSIMIVDVLVSRYGASPYAGIITSIIGTTLSGFLLSKYWVFVNTRKSSCAV